MGYKRKLVLEGQNDQSRFSVYPFQYPGEKDEDLVLRSRRKFGASQISLSYGKEELFWVFRAKSRG